MAAPLQVYRRPPRREIVVPWTCLRTGDCCIQTPAVSMTPPEAWKLGLAAKLTGTRVVMGRDGAFVVLKAAPCPFLRFDSGLASCSVHAIRPYNCRRFMCGRTSVTEGYEADPDLYLGCRNLHDRLDQSLEFREHYRAAQRRHQREWAEPHGWHRKMKG